VLFDSFGFFCNIGQTSIAAEFERNKKKRAEDLVAPLEQFSNHFMDDLRRLAAIVA